jgi:AcrR family transcriptional regulator
MMDKKKIYIEKSLRQFLKYGIKSVTIGDIAQHLNISTKTIYKLFGDKTGLVKACLELDQEIIANTYQKILQNEALMMALIEFYNELVDRISRVNANYFNDLHSYFPEEWEKTTQYSIEQIKILLEKGKAQGFFYKNLDKEVVAQTLSLLVAAMLDDHTFTQYIPNRRQLSANIIYPYLRGICTRKGWEEVRQYLSKAVML